MNTDFTVLEKTVESTAERLRAEIESGPDDAFKSGDKAAAWQASFMELGEQLEAAGYEDSDVIHELEVCCELCYQATADQMDVGLVRQSLIIECKELSYHFFYSMRAGMHRLSITSILKNEPDIIEWIEYHRLVGVDHFYLYDNESTDGLQEKLKPYIDDGIVTYTYYPGAAKQDDSVNDAIERFKYETKYLAVIDGDEYIVPTGEGVLLPDLIDDIIIGYKKQRYHPGGFAGGVGINWRDYGTSGHKEPVDGLVIENYVMRGEDDYFQNVHIKTIYNPRVVDYVDNPHNGHYRDGYYTISEHGSIIPFIYFYDNHCDLIRINHYFSKSEAQILAKNKRGWPVGDLVRDDNVELFEASVNCNRIEDTIMLRYVDEVRGVMNRMKTLEERKNAGGNYAGRREVVFLPYKASMWDSLESVWKRYEDDPEVDAYVVPIPYYDKNPDGSFRDFHYEGDQYPDYVRISDYRTFDLARRHPDEIYIHNPYDEYNYVTTIDPSFYTSELKKYTDRLIYIPYFVLSEPDPDNEEVLEGIEHFVVLPGVIRADEVIVQSENMRQAYINILTKKSGESTRSQWEEKIKGYGSPKFDKVLSVSRDDVEMPEEWSSIIKRPDGSSKKVIIYNTSVSALLEHGEEMLDKMRRVFDIFRENSDDVVLLWRPHPLIEATISSMRPALWEAYQQLVAEYKEMDFGIYDDTPDLDRAIAVSDAYYGDWSSLVQLCQKAGIPVMIQDPKVE